MNYSTLFIAACWAAMLCWALGEIGSARQVGTLAAAREEACVIIMGRRLVNLEQQVAHYLRVYDETLRPRLEPNVEDVTP